MKELLKLFPLRSVLLLLPLLLHRYPNQGGGNTPSTQQLFLFPTDGKKHYLTRAFLDLLFFPFSSTQTQGCDQHQVAY